MPEHCALVKVHLMKSRMPVNEVMVLQTFLLRMGGHMCDFLGFYAIDSCVTDENKPRWGWSSGRWMIPRTQVQQMDHSD